MRSLHYPIRLPDAFDMRTIERRVRDRASAFDGLEGLALKAFLMTSIAQGADENLYAPFYVWDNEAAMADFLSGPLFHAVIQSFGRPRVFDRPVLQFNIASRNFAPQVATIEEIALDAKQPIIDAYWAESAAQRRALNQPGLFAAASVLDAASWTVSRIGLWHSAADASDVSADAQRLSVLAVVGNAVQPQSIACGV
jgi:hypothetical protein